MADYIYLLETRLSPAQQRAIGTVRAAAREHEVTLFLTGGAVRDLTGGGSIRDLDMTVQGELSSLRKTLEGQGVEVTGENAPARQLFLLFPGGVRVELSSAMTVTYPKPGKPNFEPGTLSDDLRRRDFTANAMAISLNDGSYGLLMDPLNGVADIENRELRLVSNYGFIEDPSRLIRAARLISRLGWQMEERTKQRYDTAKEEGYISALSAWSRGYELEEVFHEEDPVRVMRALEGEGWMTALSAVLGSAKANTAGLAELAERQGQLQTQGIVAQSAALAFPFLTAKLTASDLSALKQLFVRPGFVREIEGLEGRTREFASRVGSKEAATPSAAWKLLHAAEPNLVLAMAHGVKTASVQSRLKTFLTESPGARQRIPYALMQEMRISRDLPEYGSLVEKLFYELMDGKLSTPEEMRAYLEPYSPPAPPPPLNLRRARAKKEARPSRAKGKKAAEVVEMDEAPITVAAVEEAVGVAASLMEAGTLTGPDRGPEPTRHEPLAGKVVPEVEPVRAAGKRAVVIVVPAPGAAKTVSKVATPPPRETKATVAVSEKAPAKKAEAPKSAVPVKQTAPIAAGPAPTKKSAVPQQAPSRSDVSAKSTARPSAAATQTKAVTRGAQTAVKGAGSSKAAAVKSSAGKTALPAKKLVAPSTGIAAKKAAPPKKAATVKAAPAKPADSKASAGKKPVAKKAAAKKPAGRR